MTAARIIPLGLLLAYAAAFGTRAFGGGLLVFDDHPGQLYRVWHVVIHGFAPWRWNDGWWAGYPELQFYPPGFAYAAALLHELSLATVDVAGAYMGLVWLGWLAPGVTTYLLLVRVLGNGWLALPGAFLALTLSADLTSGVEGGVHVGMVPARLGWALLPVLALALTRAQPGMSAAVAPLVAAVVLVHPAHVPAAVVLVGLAALAHRPRTAALAQAVAVLALAAMLTAFWTLPLLVRVGETRALAWGSLATSSLGRLPSDPLLLLLLALAAAPALLRRARPITEAQMLLSSFPWVMAGVVLVDAVVLEPLGARWLPADRVVDAAWLGVVAAAGLTLGRLLEHVVNRIPQAARGASRVAAVAATIGVAVLTSLPASTLTLWPTSVLWPTYAATSRGLRLPELWATLRDRPPGRILFVRSGVPLVYGGEWGDAWYRPHTHITALTPVESGRAIVHGTFTHPSPVAAFVYRGTTDGGPITELAERLDGHRLFGQALDTLDARAFEAIADRLGIAAVVALDEDRPKLRRLEEAEALVRRAAPLPFVVFTRPRPAAAPTTDSPGRWRFSPEGSAGEWVSARVAYYPLWHARQNQTLATRRGALGDLEVRLARAGEPVELHYGPGVAEHLGVAVSAASVVVGLLVLARRRRASRSLRRPQPD